MGARTSCPSDDCSRAKWSVLLAGASTNIKPTHLVILRPLVPSFAVDGHRFSPTITVIRSLELLTPVVNDSSYPLEENVLYPLIQLCDPVVQVRVAFQVQSVNLCGRPMSTVSGATVAGIQTAAWTLPRSSRKASDVYEHVDSSSTERRISLYRSMTLFVLSCKSKPQ